MLLFVSLVLWFYPGSVWATPKTFKANHVYQASILGYPQPRRHLVDPDSSILEGNPRVNHPMWGATSVGL